jgi:hypothetical protein
MKIWKRDKLKSEKISKMQKKSRWNCEMIWNIWKKGIWKKGKLKCEMIWKVWKKDKSNNDKIWTIRKKGKMNRK